ncbi:hypothetical protein C8R44DRAFT_742959 [Mycena epipterygia]|nr:hypothetical protein C8R44DRAFT_742959 [Mycena epipterygia]
MQITVHACQGTQHQEKPSYYVRTTILKFLVEYSTQSHFKSLQVNMNDFKVEPSRASDSTQLDLNQLRKVDFTTSSTKSRQHYARPTLTTNSRSARPITWTSPSQHRPLARTPMIFLDIPEDVIHYVLCLSEISSMIRISKPVALARSQAKKCHCNVERGNPAAIKPEQRVESARRDVPAFHDGGYRTLVLLFDGTGDTNFPCWLRAIKLDYLTLCPLLPQI